MSFHQTPTPLWIALAVFATLGAGCASTCLRTPVSTKVSNEIVETCRSEAEDSLDRRDIFDRYVRILWARGEYAKVVALSRKVLSQHAERTDARFYLAVGLRKLDRCGEALPHYRRYAKRRSNDADPYFGIGLCQEKLGDTARALAAYRAYLAREKRPDRQAWRRRAEERIAALGGSGLAMVGYRRAPAVATLRRTPRTARRSTPIARRAPIARRTPVARAVPAPRPKPVARPAIPASCAAHEAAIKKNPFDTAAYQRFAVCSRKRSEHAAAIKRLRVGVRDNPEWAEGWLHLGLSYKATGQSARAKRAFARACKGKATAACGL